MSDFLLELLTEEIPARMQAKAADDLRRLSIEGFGRNNLDYGNIWADSTPRRLVLSVEGLPGHQPDQTEEKRGPRTDAPATAIEGFLKSAGITREQCKERETPKGTFLFATLHTPGRATADVLAGLVAEILLAFPWPKSMRWGNGAFRWVRPLQNILAIFNGQPLPGGFALGHVHDATAPLGYVHDVGACAVTALPYNATTVGHRVHAPEPLAVTGAAGFADLLERQQVILFREKRKQLIRAKGEHLAGIQGLTVDWHEGLLEEVAGLVEQPTPLLGHIDEEYMHLPPEVLTTSMKNHQKYFSLKTTDGKLAPFFLTVANQETADGGKAIIAGNERVLRARLSDAAYFWDRDCKVPLHDFNTRLESVVFHAQLGSVADKAGRVAELGGKLGRWLYQGQHGATADDFETAGALCKADLASGMVGEFPELQGIMGGYYARIHDETEAVALAIREHHQPQGPTQPVPTAPVSVAVALADKLDTLFWFFAIGELPTGSRDPFALRRAGLGIIRLILDNHLKTNAPELQLTPLFGCLWHIGRNTARLTAKLHDDSVLDTLSPQLKSFLRERFEHHVESTGYRRDVIRAVLNTDPFENISLAFEKIEKTTAFLQTADAAALLAAFRRAANILGIEEKNDKTTFTGTVDPRKLVEAAEVDLQMSLSGEAIWFQAGQTDFAVMLEKAASLRPALDAFFDQVLVNDPDPDIRLNRLNLLARFRNTLLGIADFSQIQVDEK